MFLNTCAKIGFERGKRMATTHFRCHDCEHVGPEAEFKVDDGHQCPKCLENGKHGEDVFPHRVFRCQDCGHIDTVPDDFFGLAELELDPIEEGWLALCSNMLDNDVCGSARVVQVANDDHNRIIDRLPIPESEEPIDWKARRGIMARSFYKEWRDYGLTNQQIIELSTQLLQLVANDEE
ncbi:MAG: hypothetical protein ABIG32_01905 [Candidatus Uhrbacteria bacterium]|nr:hypothetical protein [Patescibacteria group bacterium]MBU1907221.1 hypothetical protein [Patescibacteria group bacterium]